VCVAVAAEEAPPEVAARGDLLVDGVPGFARVLEILAAQH
jgi:hypothetical protein